MTEKAKLQKLEELESSFDNVFQELLYQMRDIIEQPTKNTLLDIYGDLAFEIQSALKTAYPQHNFINF